MNIPKDSERCRGEIWHPGAFRPVRCISKAKTAAGFCGVHDPEAKKARASKRNAARGPSSFDLRQDLRARVRSFLIAELGEECAASVIGALAIADGIFPIRGPITWTPPPPKRPGAQGERTVGE